MDDEDKTEDQTQESEELEQVASETVEEPQVEAEEEAVEAEVETEEPEADEPEEPEEPAPVSNRENERIRKLTEKLAQATNRPQPSPQQSQVIDEGDYTLDEVNSRAQQYGDQRYNEGVQQAKAIEFKLGLKMETPIVAQKYDDLNPNSENFDLGQREFIDELYLKTVGYDQQTGTVQRTDIGYEEFVDGFKNAVNRTASVKSADSSRNLAKQASQTGVRPNSVAKKTYDGTDPSKMSLEQLQSAALAEAKARRF